MIKISKYSWSFPTKTALITWILILTVLTEGKVCPGFCVPSSLCTNDGGKILGFCVDQRVCCDVSHKLNRSSCGKSISWENKPVHFLSPSYPGFSSGSLICSFEVKLDKNAVGVKLELDHFELDQKMFDGVTRCDADMLLLKGFSNWMTDPRCGNLNGYSILLDIEKGDYPEKKVVILFILSSRRYRWNIRIQQILTKKLRKSELCIENRMKTWEKNPHFVSQLNVSQNPVLFPSLTPMTLPKTSWKWEATVFLQVNAVELKGMTSSQSMCPQNRGQQFLVRLCSAALVDDRHVITTISCFSSQPPISKLKIEFGPTDQLCPDFQNLVNVESISVHFNFISTMQTNDLAVIRTKTLIMFGDVTQPLKLVAEYPPLFQKLFFSSITPHLSSDLGQREVNIYAIVPDNLQHCSLALASKLQLTRETLKELQGSNKYHGLLQSWICFDISIPESSIMTPVPSPDLGQDSLSLKMGSPLMSSTTVTGSDLRLMGIFSHVIRQHVHVSEQQQNFLLQQNSSRSSASPFCPKKLIFFNNLSFYRKWILMAIS